MGTLLTGFALGVAFTLGAVWLPSRARWRTRIAEIRDIVRIERGWTNHTDEQPELDDAQGAFAQARVAYLAVYPGRSEQPDPAWVAWIREGGRRVEGRHHYLGSHVAQELQIPQIETVQVVTTDLSQFPVWGARDEDTHPPAAVSAPESWALKWRQRERLLVPLALAFAVTQRRGKYPWWQKIADRVWEAGVVYEVSAQRVNGATVRGVFRFVDRMAWGLIDIWLALAGSVVAFRRLFPARDPSVYRPKRYYPIKEA